ncbi:MAG: PglB [Lachnospiraceae bacterium]|nr:PglB [Lachnospiraceae bacterium]
MSTNLLIIGAGDLGAIAKEIAEKMGRFDKIDFLDDKSELAIGKTSDIEKYSGEYQFGIAAIGDHELRYRYTLKLEDNCFQIPILVHPRAFVGKYASIQKGCIIEPMATVHSGATLGVGVVVSAGAIVNHSTFIGDYSHLNVGSIVEARSIMRAGTKLNAGNIFNKIDDLSDKTGNGTPTYKVDEAWVQQYVKDFGTEPSFF